MVWTLALLAAGITIYTAVGFGWVVYRSVTFVRARRRWAERLERLESHGGRNADA